MLFVSSRNEYEYEYEYICLYIFVLYAFLTFRAVSAISTGAPPVPHSNATVTLNVNMPYNEKLAERTIVG